MSKIKKLINIILKNLPAINIKLIFLIILFLIVNNANYLAGLVKSHQSNEIYYAPTMLNDVDYSVYLSMIEQGKDGHLFSKNLYNPESSKRLLFSPHWYIIGQFSKISHINTIWSFHIFRIILSIIFIVFLYWWLKFIFIEKNYRLLSLFLIIFANGVAPLFPVEHFFKIIPTNLLMAESISFLTLNINPLFILSQLLILSIITLFIKSIKHRQYIYWAGLLNIILILIHPYDILIVNSILSVFALIKFVLTKNKQYLINLFYIYISSLLASLYYFYILTIDQNLQRWNEQNVTLSDDIRGYFWGFGLLTILSILGVIEVIKRKLIKNDYILIIIIWAMLAWVLVYLPVQFNRRLSNGWHIALTITSSIYIISLIKYYNPNKKYIGYLKNILLGIIIFFIAINSFIMIAHQAIINFNGQERLGYFKKSKLKLYNEIKINCPDEEVVLAIGSDGNTLPAMTGKKTYLGHYHQTWDLENKIDDLKKIISNEKNNLYEWLLENKISCIMTSQKLNSDFQNIKWLENENYIQVISSDKDFLLYKVIK